jgi:hypothetical protein
VQSVHKCFNLNGYSEELRALRADSFDRINRIFLLFLYPDHLVHPVKKRKFLYYQVISNKHPPAQRLTCIDFETDGHIFCGVC